MLPMLQVDFTFNSAFGFTYSVSFIARCPRPPSIIVMTTELRRSSRARKQPKSYAEEQAEAQPAVSKPKTSSKTNPKQRAKTGVQEDDDIKDVSLTNADVNRESDFDDDVNSAPKKKKKKRAKKATIEEEVEGGQLYSHPAHGSIVQWGSKTRKFPKIYVVPEPQRETRTKRDDGGKEEKNVDRLNDAGEVAVRRELAKIKKLKPGQEEARLRE